MILLPTHEPGTHLAVVSAGATCPRCAQSHMLFVVRHTLGRTVTRCIGCDTLQPGKPRAATRHEEDSPMACPDPDDLDRWPPHAPPPRRPPPTYVLSPDGRAITCLQCGTISWRPRDIAERYCEPCHRVHDEAR